MQESCENCRYFLEDEFEKRLEMGACRRRKPFHSTVKTSWCGEYGSFFNWSNGEWFDRRTGKTVPPESVPGYIDG